MSLSAAQLLIVSEALHDLIALADNVDFVFPTATRFTDKADYWSFVDQANNTMREIETELINACWINFLRFEDSARDTDSIVKTLIYEFVLFTEATFERLDEADTPDAFNAKVSKTDHEHDTAIFSIQSQFGYDEPISLADASFADSHTNYVAQIDNTQRLTPCPFIADGSVFGSLTRLECRFMTRLC